MRDLELSQTTLVSLSSSGDSTNGPSSEPQISPDGRFVTFMSNASNLSPADTNEFNDIYIHDRTTGETKIASISPSGEGGNADSSWANLSPDGRYVTFCSKATNLVTGFTDGLCHIYLHDLQNDQTIAVSASLFGTPGNGYSISPIITSDGTRVIFESDASHLISGDTNGKLNLIWPLHLKENIPPIDRAADVLRSN